MEKSFEDLLEEYLDEDEINQIIKKDNYDYYNETKKENIKIESPFTKDNCISISNYVTSYLGISGDFKDLFHCGLKELNNPYVMGVDNNFANKNPELVHNGYLLLVIDSHNNRGTYINPSYLKSLVDSEKIEKIFKSFQRQRVTDLKNLKMHYLEFERIRQQVDNNKKFFKLLEETHKIRKLNMLKESEKNNGKY